MIVRGVGLFDDRSVEVKLSYLLHPVGLTASQHCETRCVAFMLYLPIATGRQQSRL